MHNAMKNFFSFAFGLLLLGSVFPFYSSASNMRVVAVPSSNWRQAYRYSGEASCPRNTVDIRVHFENSKKNNCYRPSLQVRGTTDRRGPFKYKPSQAKEVYQSLEREYVFSHRRISEREIIQNWQVLRKAQPLRFPAKYPRYENTIPSGKIVVRKGNEVSIPQATSLPKEKVLSDMTDFEIMVPDGFVQNSNGVYQNRRSTLSFRIRKVKNGDYKCVEQSFLMCAMNSGRSFQKDQALANVASRDTKMRVMNISTPQGRISLPRVTEYFTATGFGTENVYFTFTTLDPRDGSVLRIEAVARSYETEPAAEIMYSVFESFSFHFLSLQ